MNSLPKRLLIGLAIALAVPLVAAGPPEAVASAINCSGGTCTMDSYNPNYGEPEKTNCWCATAVAEAALEYYRGGTSGVPSQVTLDPYMKPHNYWDWTRQSFSGYTLGNEPCVKHASGLPDIDYFANDSRGIAWGLYGYRNQTIGFRDFVDSDKSDLEWQIVLNIRSLDRPAPVTVKNGRHEVLVVGFTTDEDPIYGSYAGSGNAIDDFWIWDPWNNTGWNWSGWGGGDGYTGNAMITLSTWNNSIFLKDTHEGLSNESNSRHPSNPSPYYNKYVAVLQAVDSTSPDVNTSYSFGANWYANLNRPANAPSSSMSDDNAVPAAYSTLGAALSAGLVQNRLFNLSDFGSIGTTYSIGTVLPVESYDPTVPSYDLVEVVSGGSPSAIAIVDTVPGGFRFSELLGITPGSHLPSQAQLTSTISAAGLTGPARLVYGPTAEGMLQGTPFVVGVDKSGHPAFANAGPATPEFTPASV